jgi:hypothetical protein
MRNWKWENQLALAILTLSGAVPFGTPRRQANPLGMSRLVKETSGPGYLMNFRKSTLALDSKLGFQKPRDE